MRKRISVLLFISCLLLVNNENIQAGNFVQNNYSISQDSLYVIANNLFIKRDFTSALPLFEKALVYYTIKDNKKEVGDCYLKIGSIKYFYGQYEDALKLYQESLKNYEAVEANEGSSNALNNIGAIYYYLSNYSKALSYYKKAVQIQEKGGYWLNVAASKQNIGGIYSHIGDYDNALIYYDEAYIIFLKKNDKKSIAQNLNVTADIYIKKKN